MVARVRARSLSSRLLLRLARVLDSTSVRVGLSVAIIFSLIPEPFVHSLEPTLLAVFAVEFGARLLLALRREPSTGGHESGWQRPRLGACALLGLDLVALMSFLPLAAASSPWMRILRLSRFVVLLGYWAPVMRDLRTVMLRHERTRQVIVMGMVVALLAFAGALVLQQREFDVSGIDYDEDGAVTSSDRAFFTKLWWAFRQIQDPGNMLQAPGAVAAAIVSLALTVAGLFLVSFLIGLGTDVVREMLEIGQRRPPGLHGHTVVVNTNASTGQLLGELMTYYQKLLPREDRPLSRRWLALRLEALRRGLFGPRYVVVGKAPLRPEFLQRGELSRIVYRCGVASDESFMVRADIAQAQRVVLLADASAESPDAETTRAALTIVEGLRDPRRPDTSEGAVAGSNLRAPRARARATDGHLTHQSGRARLLIAEVLDERNVPAAWAALAAGGGELRAFIVVVDRMIALFLACVGRTAGVGPVLSELLTCAGRELYTCFFDHEAPLLPSDPQEALARLTGRARAGKAGVVPLGLLYEQRDELGIPDLAVAIGGEALPPSAGAPAPACSGFLALAPNFTAVRRLAEAIQRRPEAEGWPAAEVDAARRAAEGASPLRPDPPLPLRRVLVCGFRPATVALCEAIVLAEPEAEVVVLVASEAERAAAAERLHGHRDMVQRRLLRGYHGGFVAAGAPWEFVYQPQSGGPARGRLRLQVGDASAPLVLVDLPGGAGHVAAFDLIYILSSAAQDSDARGAQILMTLDALLMRTDSARCPRVVAEFVEAELAHRLRQRYAALGVARVQVYSTENLRAYFLFQAVLIPGFARVYGQLLAPWGHSFGRLLAEGVGSGRCSFDALALRVAEAGGGLLLGVELTRPGGACELLLGGGPAADAIDLSRLHAAWVVAPDPSARV